MNTHTHTQYTSYKEFRNGMSTQDWRTIPIIYAMNFRLKILISNHREVSILTSLYQYLHRVCTVRGWASTSAFLVKILAKTFSWTAATFLVISSMNCKHFVSFSNAGGLSGNEWVESNAISRDARETFIEMLMNY